MNNAKVSPVFDPTPLAELFELQEGLVEGLVAEYEPVSLSLVEAIHKGAAENDRDLMERSAHSLKSSSRALGLERLADLAYEIESAHVEGNDISETLSRLTHARLEAIAAIQNFLSARK